MINVAFFWIMTSVMSGISVPTPECAELLDSGNAAYDQFITSKALDCYKRAYKICPGNYDALMKMVRALDDVGEDRDDASSGAFFSEALRYADSLQKRFPDSSQSYFLKAISAGNLARLKGGREQFIFSQIVELNIKKSITVNPTFAPAYIVLGFYYREIATLGLFRKTLVNLFLGAVPPWTLQDSEQALNKALELSPRNVAAHLELAKTRVAMADTTGAIALLEKMGDCPVYWHLDGRFKQEGGRLLERIRNKRQ